MAQENTADVHNKDMKIQSNKASLFITAVDGVYILNTWDVKSI